MRRILYILFLWAGLSTALLGAETASPDTVTSALGITVETSVDRSEIYIGDLINYRLTIIHDSNIVLTPPPIGANLGAFDVKDYQTDESTRLKDGRIKVESRFSLTTFTTGDYIIPPIPVEFMLPDSTVKYLISEPTPIKVKSLLAESSDTADIRDIKGPIEFKTSYALYYYFGGAFLILAAVAAYIFWRIRRKRMQQGEPVDLRKPWEIAFEELALLKEKNYPSDGQFKQFYVELTEIVRAYLGRIYTIPVLDMTTEEFLVVIMEEEIDEQLFSRLKNFLGFADLVKFAKLIPEMDKVIQDYDEAVNIVEYIRQVETSRVSVAGEPIATTGGGLNV
ncbi:MAG: BatD family protein [candidate division Zixibacteria bacterium]|nr:BatD family protein [candidate division Zixibacteria bacterium]